MFMVKGLFVEHIKWEDRQTLCWYELIPVLHFLWIKALKNKFFGNKIIGTLSKVVHYMDANKMQEFLIEIVKLKFLYHFKQSSSSYWIVS